MKKIFIILTILFMFPIGYSALCDGFSTTNACSTLISQSGHGAVELCDNCYVCGEADGVCPGDFSDGQLETDPEKRRVLMKIGTDQRPSQEILNSTQNRTIFSTGDNACQSISADCSGIYSKNSQEGSLSLENGISCSEDITNIEEDNYLVAQCTDVYQRGSCLNCADPDCKTNIKGFSYDRDTSNFINATIRLSQSNNNNINNLEGLTAQAQDGYYEFEGVTGELTVTCSAEGYDPETFLKTINRGQNIVDCPMGEAQCSAECTIPDSSGNNICRASCDGRNSCSFGEVNVNGDTYDTQSICDGQRSGSFIVLDQHNSTHVAGVECCTGNLEYKNRPRFSLDPENQDNNIRNILTRDYSRQIGDEPVTVRIIVYE